MVCTLLILLFFVAPQILISLLMSIGMLLQLVLCLCPSRYSPGHILLFGTHSSPSLIFLFPALISCRWPGRMPPFPVDVPLSVIEFQYSLWIVSLRSELSIYSNFSGNYTGYQEPLVVGENSILFSRSFIYIHIYTHLFVCGPSRGWRAHRESRGRQVNLAPVCVCTRLLTR